MIRVLSALVLLPVVFATIWLLPPAGTLALAEIVLVLAFIEYAAVARQLGARVATAPAAVAAGAVCASLGWPTESAEAPMMAATVALGAMTVASARRGTEALQDVTAAAFPMLYLGLPLGALAGLRTREGPEVVLLLLLTVMISDTAQYYGGRLLGRHALAPVISPKKTVEGAIAGLVCAMITVPLLGRWWLPDRPAPLLSLLGVAMGAFGIMGDLFESLLKRSAGLKDTSGLIPGHGGMLDRIDSMLFAVPVYYVFVRYS